jgi:hypothetical protein
LQRAHLRLALTRDVSDRLRIEISKWLKGSY